MYKSPVLVVFFLCLSVFSFSQEPDSILLKKATSAFELASVNSDSALQIAKDVLKLSKERRFTKGMANSYNALGWAYMHKGKMDSSLVSLHEAKKLFESTSSNYDVVRVNINITEVLTKQSRFAEALDYALEAESLANKIGDLPLQTDTKRLLGILYREQGDLEKSVSYFNQAITGFEKLGDIRRSVNTAISLSILLRKMNLADSSLTVLEKCLSLAQNQPNNDYQLAMIREHLGDSHYQKGDFQASLGDYLAAFRLFEKLGNMADVAYEAIVVGKTQVSMGKYEDADRYLSMAYAVSDSLGFTNYQYDASVELAALYQKTGQWEKATKQLGMSLQLKDSLANQMQLQKMAELKEKFESEKQEQEIALLKANIDLESSRSRRRMQLQYFVVAVFLLAIILAYLIFNRYQLSQKLKEQELRNQISSDLHDDLGSTLSSIDINSRIALLKIDDGNLVASQLQKIQENSKTILDSLSHIVWSINPSNDSVQKVISKMKDFASEVFESQGILYRFKSDEEDLESKINPLIRKNIYLIFKEAVNNSAKYSFAENVEIEVGFKNQWFHLSIIDDGKGFDIHESGEKGNGLRNMRLRAEQIQGDLTINSQVGQGTSIHFKVHIP
ncbi:tetratricopeptide repeat protein [Cognataquiflexum rubidum]|uniref:ATP-binding protein n=1 Tax=Cognataquiflexum rubidum TaxID=2922273 RepID=UPI001F131A97|nr:tetratricopeptide repeat protein [Cognataquiflexum rubidum]MCH6233630.1 tetratricopeptide repeat protein [Cognataquiflexum rubidum]